MTLISSLILDALREGNILPLGRAPTTNQQAEALRLYNSCLAAIYGDEAGEGLADWPLGSFGRENVDICLRSVEYPPINSRLIAMNDAALTVYLPPNPQDGSRIGIADPAGRLATVPITLDANGRTIQGFSTVVLDTNGTSAEWFYRADLGDWALLSQRAETDQSPFPADFDMFFVTLLALRLNPRYGREMDPQSAAIFKSERRKFVARYLQSRALEIDDSLSWPFMTSPRGFSSMQAFNRGRYGGA